MNDCPTLNTPCETMREYDGYWTQNFMLCDRPDYIIVADYQDNRENIGYYYESGGTVTFENLMGEERIFKFRYEVPYIYVPSWLPVVNLDNICMEENGALVFFHEVMVQPGQILTYEFNVSVEFADPNEGADFNGDYAVDSIDLGMLLAGYGPVDVNNIIFDLNGDGEVDSLDLGILLANWNDQGTN